MFWDWMVADWVEQKLLSTNGWAETTEPGKRDLKQGVILNIHGSQINAYSWDHVKQIELNKYHFNL